MAHGREPVIMTAESGARTVPTTHLEVSTSSETAARLHWRARVYRLGGGGGMRLQMDGWVTLSGTYARLRIQRVAPHEASHERTKLIPIVARGRTVPAMRWPDECSVPADTRLALRVCDFEGHALTPERDAGVCHEGSSEAEIPLPLAALLSVRLSVHVDARPGLDERGFVLTTTGALTLLNGLKLRLEFWPNKGGTEHSAMEWPVLQPGRRLFGRERELGGIASGSWLLIRFLDEQGKAIDEERVVGRCVLQ